MRESFFYGLLLIPFIASAQPMDDERMEQMMNNMQAMQECMAGIDEAEMQAFQQKAEAMDAEVKILCAEGKRDAAMKRAMAFGKEAAASDLMRQMQKCGQDMKHMMPQTAQSHEDAGGKPRHVCDQ